MRRGRSRLTTPPSPRETTSVLGPQWEGSGRESLTRFIPLRLKPTGSADDGKRSALDVLVDRGYQGDSWIQSFGLATPVGVGSLGLMFFLHQKSDLVPYFITCDFKVASDAQLRPKKDLKIWRRPFLNRVLNAFIGN